MTAVVFRLLFRNPPDGGWPSSSRNKNAVAVAGWMLARVAMMGQILGAADEDELGVGDARANADAWALLRGAHD